MARRLRVAAGGVVYHVLNRAVGRGRIFRKEGDYKAFEKVLLQAHERTGTRLLAYCLMPNHWHLVLWPREDGELSQYVRWLSVTHTQRWHAHHHSAGTGPLYQGRFKSFPVQKDGHFRIVCRYVERNPVRGGLVARASDWRWSSAAGGAAAVKAWLTPREAWPVPAPADWEDWVNAPVTRDELDALRRSVVRGAPFGDDPTTRGPGGRHGDCRWSQAFARRTGPKSRGKRARRTPDPLRISPFAFPAYCLMNNGYVEANPLRARMVARAEEWRWSSLGGGAGVAGKRVQLAQSPVARPAGWVERVNAMVANEELERLRSCIRRSRPFGDDAWVRRTARRLGLQSTLRDPWRPKKPSLAAKETDSRR